MSISSNDLDRFIMISTDGHAGLPPERYKEYVPKIYHDEFDKQLVEQIKMTQIAEKAFLIDEFNEEWRKGIENELKGAYDSDVRLGVLDNDGVVAEVLFPDGITEMNTPPFGAGLGLKTWGLDPDLQWVGAQAHNRWMVEFVEQAPDRRIGLAVVPICYDIPKAVEEIKWAHANGLKGILMPSVWGEYPAYNSQVYYPIWEICQELDMVVHTHSGPSDEKDMTLPGAVGVYLMEFHWWAARPLWTMLMGGVFEFFPKLKFAMTEVGEFWIPGMIEMMDIRASVKHTSGKLGDFRTHLKMEPSEYFARNCRVGASALMDKQSVDARYDIGINNMMWGTDYPHPEGTWPRTASQMQECFGGVPTPELDRILGLNAIEFYGLNYDRCREIAAKIGPQKNVFNSTA